MQGRVCTVFCCFGLHIFIEVRIIWVHTVGTEDGTYGFITCFHSLKRLIILDFCIDTRPSLLKLLLLGYALAIYFTLFASSTHHSYTHLMNVK